MFKKKQRYPFKEGIPTNCFNCEYFNLRYQKNTIGYLRLAIVAGKKIDKRAVVRHRLKRIFSSALREILTDEEVAYDLIFFLKNSLKDRKYQEIKETIKNALEKIKVI